MTKPKPVRVTVVTAKNRRTGAIETRRWSKDITKYDAIGHMGWWLHQLGWHHSEIMITGCGTHIDEDPAVTATRVRLIG